MKNNGFFSSIKARFERFMVGRYGFDSLYYFLLGLSCVLVVINIFAGNLIISAIDTALFAYAIYRALSRNIYKRQQENEKYLKFIEKPKAFYRLQKCKHRDRKTHVYKKCPACKNKLRLPKQKGKHTVVCPCCKNRFDVRI